MASRSPTVSEPPLLSDGKRMRMNGFVSTSDWVLANVEHKDGKRYCMCLVPEVQVKGILGDPEKMVRCTQSGWSTESSTSTIQKHFEKHGILSPVQKKTLSPSVAPTETVVEMLKRAEAGSSTVGAGVSRNNSFSSKDDTFALAFAMNATHSLSVVDDPYWRTAFGSRLSECSRISNRQTLRAHILDLSQRLEKQREATLRGVVGLQVDGGKDCNGRKIIACCYMHPSTRQSFVHKLLDTLQAALTEDWHRINIVEVVSEIMAGGKVFVQSVTHDNEASQVAGIAAAIRLLLPWIIQFRCGAHSLELLIKYCYELLPGQLHKIPADAASSLVSTIKNNKAIGLALAELQRAANGQARPLVLVQSCNTRKWSADYLVVARVLKLQGFISMLYQNPAYAAVLGEEPDWQLMKNFCKRVFPLYLCEQIIQRDSSNAIHLAFFWKKCCDAVVRLAADVEDVARDLAAQGMDVTQTQSRAAKLRRKVAKRDKAMESCGVLALCHQLWPCSPPPQDWPLMEGQMHDFIARCFPKWIEFRDVLCLPSDCSIERGYLELHVQATQQLSILVSGQDPFVIAARSVFSRNVEEAERMFEVSDDNIQPRPSSEQCRRSKKAGIYWSAVQTYWETFRFRHPHIYFIFDVLSHCCATEAGTERMFSSEKQIHSAIRQAMGPELTEAFIRIRWNFEPIMQFLGIGARAADVHDVDPINYA